MSEDREFTYFCPCGEPVGSRHDTTRDPRIITSKKARAFEFGYDEVERRVDFHCLCGRDYDGTGKWVDREEVERRPIPEAMFVAKPEIEPHFNQSLGMEIESRKHLEAMQEKFGVEDVVVKGDGEKFVPRDFEHQHTEAVAALEENSRLAAHATPVEDGLEIEEFTHLEEAS